MLLPLQGTHVPDRGPLASSDCQSIVRERITGKPSPFSRSVVNFNALLTSLTSDLTSSCISSGKGLINKAETAE